MDLPTPVKVVVLASGSGTLMQALIEATRRPGYPADVVAVGTDRAGAEALTKAERADVPHFSVRLSDHPDRAAWDKALAEAVGAYEPDLVVSAGFMKLLGNDFLARFANRVINTHPALLPSFPGMHAVADALAMGVKVSGSTVHFVDAGMDTGPIIAQEAVVVETDDDEARLHERIKVVERRLLVEVVERLGRGGCTVDGRKVIFR
ncbi:phosphoribosylglycinamide formyltransferase [Amycolatopsis acidiphila]|uniref:Phosphoribosylglycinamide formyltransferase n=1 Tax=Amycolatopsis acidiphila TaxID=715473 RepID=A0A557ZNL7_9PSEU|nr:phosphoribosylglycinamide formyltransferase [Amycolatopsis acidiphila]TVT13588.1 phosphoribosylglycinamide formyltransferase [Amycolatopsis acidiphila]UIJ64199.1 phosphoribosylglycinamide formyltransferase [Amycolatopsis acidiphila]